MPFENGHRLSVGRGRPKGAKDRKRLAQAQLAEAAGVTPLEYLLAVMRNEHASAGERLDAAKSAAPYMHARLSNVQAEVSVAQEKPLIVHIVPVEPLMITDDRSSQG